MNNTPVTLPVPAYDVIPPQEWRHTSILDTILTRLADNVEAVEEEIAALENTVPDTDIHKGVKRGVWVDGKLRLQTRDTEAIDDFAVKMMRKRHSVWVAPIGAFQS
jgi:hypothetical protein